MPTYRLTINCYVTKYGTGQVVEVSSLPGCYVKYENGRQYTSANNVVVGSYSGSGTYSYQAFFPADVGCDVSCMGGYSYSSSGAKREYHVHRTTVPERVGLAVPFCSSGHTYSAGSGSPQSVSWWSEMSSDPDYSLRVAFYYQEKAKSVTIQQALGGSVSCSPDTDLIVEGTLVTLTVSPDTGCHLSRLTALRGESALALTKVNDTTYTFTMPTEDVVIKPVFETEPNITIHPSEHGTVTTDIDGGVAGAVITVTTTPETFDYMLTELSCVVPGRNISLTKVDNYTYTFVMPGSPVDIYATFGLARKDIAVQVTFLQEYGVFATSFPLTIVRRANAVVYRGTWWTLYSSGLLHIHCVGDMPGIPWTDYLESITSLKIENTVTNIPAGAFNGCKNLNTVEIPDSVQSFGHSSFAYTGLLHGMRFPSGLTTIPPYCFEGSLLDIEVLTFPDSVTLIDSYAFRYCDNIKHVRIPVNTKLAGNGGSVFVLCNGLISATLATTATGSWTSDPFTQCTSLQWVGIGRNITSLKQYFLFAYCSSLTDVYFEGTEAEFNALFSQMTRYQNLNSYFYDATKHFNSIGPD